MSHKVRIALAVAGLAVGSFGLMGQAQASAELAGKNGCVACHAPDKKLIGPSWKDIATKYKDDKSAVDKVAAKVKAGGSGSFGPVPMPAHPNLSDADAKALVTWVFGHK